MTPCREALESEVFHYGNLAGGPIRRLLNRSHRPLTEAQAIKKADVLIEGSKIVEWRRLGLPGDEPSGQGT